jgi:DNA-binding IclR family transcriptional regulator
MDMARKVNHERLDEIHDALVERPEQKAGTLAQQLGLDKKTVMRALAQLEERGDLLAEDEEGQLSWFGSRR